MGCVYSTWATAPSSCLQHACLSLSQLTPVALMEGMAPDSSPSNWALKTHMCKHTNRS